MAIYAIGDLQGCLRPFECLLEKIGFNSETDQLWLCGDLVNRGPESLATLQRCYTMRDNLITVLGNHDLHLLAVALGFAQPKSKDTFNDILAAPQADLLLDWLLNSPLLYENQNWVITHAGIYPGWTLTQARAHAKEIQQVLQSSSDRTSFFSTMYGNTPAAWSENLTGTDRWRVITNCFTRMRLLDQNGQLDMSYKGDLSNAPAHLVPWYAWEKRIKLEKQLLFGHWAALEGCTESNSVIALDTGCVWGNRLSAFCLDNQTWYSCHCN